jgi:transposase-like protein
MSIFTDDDREEIVRRYNAGEVVRDIAKKFGCDHTYPGKLAAKRGNRRLKYKRRPLKATKNCQMSFGA